MDEYHSYLLLSSMLTWILFFLFMNVGNICDTCGLKRWRRNSYQEGIPIFQLALSSPVNWDSKAQNDRWEKRGKMSLGAQDYGVRWHRIRNFTTVAENCEWSLEILGPGIRIQEFSWNWRWRASANSNWSACKTHTRKDLVFCSFPK